MPRRNTTPLATSVAAASSSTLAKEISNLPPSLSIPSLLHAIRSAHAQQIKPAGDHLSDPADQRQSRARQLEILAHHAVLLAIVVTVERRGEIEKIERDAVGLELRGRLGDEIRE